MMNSCKKSDNKTPADIFYSVSLEGYTVTFTNQTKVPFLINGILVMVKLPPKKARAYLSGKGKFVPHYMQQLLMESQQKVLRNKIFQKTRQLIFLIIHLQIGILLLTTLLPAQAHSHLENLITTATRVFLF
jgi:hypothetical protein